MKCIRDILIMIVALFIGLSVCGQWSRSGRCEKPTYVLYSQPNGSYLLISMSDWSVTPIPGLTERKAGTFTPTYDLAGMPEEPIVVAFGLKDDNNFNDTGFLLVINLRTGKRVEITDPLKETSIARYIDDIFYKPGDPHHIYVLFSNKVSFHKQWMVPEKSRGYIMAKLNPSTMSWEKLPRPLDERELFTPGSGAIGSRPLVTQRYLRLWEESLGASGKKEASDAARNKAKGELRAQLKLAKSKSLWNPDTEADLQKKVDYALLNSGIIRVLPENSDYDPVLWYGVCYQIVWTGKSVALVRTKSDKSAIVSQCARNKIKDLGFLMETGQRDEGRQSGATNSSASAGPAVKGFSHQSIFAVLYYSRKQIK
jgi:hypothetical protein